MTPEIHERYAVEIKGLTERHFEEIDNLKRQHKVELHNHAQVYEVKISEGLLNIKKFKEIVRNHEEELQRRKNKIGLMERREEEQDRIIDELRTESQKTQTLHVGHVGRLRNKHQQELNELQGQHAKELQRQQIQQEAAERLIEELKRISLMGGEAGAETNALKKEVAELKEQLARRLKNEKRYDETLFAKDSHI